MLFLSDAGVTLFAVALGGLIGIIGGVIVPILLKYIFRPEITIGNLDSGESYHSIYIKNNGNVTAINCEAMVTFKNIDRNSDIIDLFDAKIKRNVFREIKDMNLSWARMSNGHKATLPIYPGSQRLLNFLKVYDGEGGFQFLIASEEGWRRPSVCLTAKIAKKYEGELNIYAENVKYDPKKHQKSFTIAWVDDKIDFKFTND